MVGLILFLLLPSDGSIPDAEALVSALRQEVGEQTQILVERHTGGPTVAGLRARQRELGARFAAFAATEGDSRTRARLVLVGDDITAAPLVRMLEFVSADPPHERGRAMGLLLASMMREIDPRLPSARAGKTAVPTVTKPPSAASAPAPSQRGQQHWVGVMGTSVRATSSGAWILGGELGWRFVLPWQLCTRLGLAYSRGQMAILPGQVSDFGLRLGLGVTFWGQPTPARWGAPGRWGARALLGLAISRETVNRSGEEGPTLVHWKPATTFGFELEAGIGQGLRAVLRAGLDVHWARSRIAVDGREVTTFEQIRPNLAAGLGWSF